MGEAVSENRVAHLTHLADIQAQIGYKKEPGIFGGRPSVVADETLDRQFAVDAPDRFWVTGITSLRTDDGFSYLNGVIDLSSRRVVGWAVQSRQTSELAVQALLSQVTLLRNTPPDSGSRSPSYQLLMGRVPAGTHSGEFD